MNEAPPVHDDEYKERYVAFLDLLGFKALVCAAESNQGEYARLKGALERLNQTLCNVPRWELRFTHFSDCIIITSDVTLEALEAIFSAVETLTRNLLQYDVMVRGGITRGGAFHTAQYVYGTAVSRVIGGALRLQRINVGVVGPDRFRAWTTHLIAEE
jgi:hypothetical protein